MVQHVVDTLVQHNSMITQITGSYQAATAFHTLQERPGFARETL